ncbi:MAG: cytochrome-c peroxidase [Bacteroidia bacterium]|nr:cytochrome-c peroxidase [Bacteroidia bacterium]NNJ55838.1 cytochrome-c peroxidase [Bacteroidia bacterium]
MKKTVFYLTVVIFLFSCTNNSNSSKTEESSKDFTELDEQARRLFASLPSIAADSGMNITPEKIALGKMLYFDNRLSKDSTQSCNTCHNLETFGVDNKSFSEGNDGELGERNSPTTLNAAFHIAQFWDGREPDVEAQAGGPILNPVEMAMPSEEAVTSRLSKIEEYKVAFAKAYPEDNSPITYDNLKKAIGAFERTLVTPSKFDDYIAGNNEALTNKEKEGLQRYIKAGCTTCHSGALLGGNMYQKFGLFGDYWEYTKSDRIDGGKYEVTKKESDKYIFKVPSLRNIEKTGPYFHDGSVESLDDAISIMAKLQSNQDLNAQEVNSIKVFLYTLTGEVPKESLL